MTLNDSECPIHLKVRLANECQVPWRMYVVAFRADNAWLDEHRPQQCQRQV